MIVRTTWHFRQSAEVIWPLLCDSRMQASHAPLFKFGLPQLRQCSLPDGEGGVGRRRQCDSNQGSIRQTILAWEPPFRLAFEMTDSNLPLRRYVTKLVDEFDLRTETNGETTITRTTHIEIGGRLALIRRWFVWIGLRQIHRFVFQNWERLATAATPATSRS